MSDEALYHFFPRKSKGKEETITILKSIFDNGLFLNKEILSVPWKDMYGKNKNRKLFIEQYRFCLTAVSNREELISHSEKFGYIGLEFSVDFITKLGGFPVFYVPSPSNETENEEEFKGISLLYRIAEIQELLEFVIENKVIASKDIDIENTLGAIKLLANICYPTKRKITGKQIISNYYNQREWRIIYGLTPEKVIVNNNGTTYAIKFFDQTPIFKFISKIIIKPSLDNTSRDLWLKEKITDLLSNYNHPINVEAIE